MPELKDRERLLAKPGESSIDETRERVERELREAIEGVGVDSVRDVVREADDAVDLQWQFALRKRDADNPTRATHWNTLRQYGAKALDGQPLHTFHDALKEISEEQSDG